MVFAQWDPHAFASHLSQRLAGRGLARVLPIEDVRASNSSPLTIRT